MEPEMIMVESSLHNHVLKRKRTQRQRLWSSSSDDALTMSTTTSSSTPSEEDHEVANCLILLAQGLSEYQTECKSRKIDGLYECRSCDRVFDSFQALGGHKASHKKLKVATTDAAAGPRTTTIRVHQCLICCAEFPSGQALGGHMRKHRVRIVVTHTLTTLTRADEFQCLDLNLPAAAAVASAASEEYSFSSKQHRQSQALKVTGLVLSGPALVDCHY